MSQLPPISGRNKELHRWHLSYSRTYLRNPRLGIMTVTHIFRYEICDLCIWNRDYIRLSDFRIFQECRYRKLNSLMLVSRCILDGMCSNISKERFETCSDGSGESSSKFRVLFLNCDLFSWRCEGARKISDFFILCIKVY